MIHSASVVGRNAGFASSATSDAWLAGTDGHVGVRLKREGRKTYPVATTCYGYLHLTTTGAIGYPATLVDYSCDGNAITISP